MMILLYFDRFSLIKYVTITKNLVNDQPLLVGQLLAHSKLLVVSKHLVDSNLFPVGKHLVDTEFLVSIKTEQI